MRSIIYLFTFLLCLASHANDDDQTLEVEKEGLVVMVVNFEDGDKIKLFEVETGDHILSKTHNQIDLSQLPIGSYLLENNQGKSIVIQRTEDEVNIDGVTEVEEEEFVLASDSKRVNMSSDVDVEEEFVNYYENTQTGLLEITREGDIINVVNFEDGDKIKLFEVKNTVHVLSKTEGYVDLSQLPAGVYVLENNKGESVVVEKFVDADQVAEM